MQLVGHVVHSVRLGRQKLMRYFSCSCAPVRIPEKRTKTRYDKLVFLLLLGSTGHVVHSGMSWARTFGPLFLILGCPRCITQKVCRDTLC
jgi:hypothetical protein